MAPSSRSPRWNEWAPAVVFTAGSALVVAVHPEPFGGWGVWALGPLLVLPAYAFVFRTPPRGRRLAAASSAALAYALLYGAVAGLGDESVGWVARAVYLGLPALGLAAMLACFVAVELAGAVGAWRRPAPHADEPRWDRATTRLVACATGALAVWTVVTGTGLDEPRLLVAEATSEPSGIAHVRCEGEDTFVATPTVLAQANGVRIRVENGGGGEIWLEYDLDGGSNGGGAELLDPGTSELVVRAPEKTLGVACTERGDGTASKHATITVVPVERRLRISTPNA